MSETENLRHNRKIELVQICNGRVNSAYSPTQQMNMLIFGEDLSDLKACINAHKAVYAEHMQALLALDHEGLEVYDLHTGWPESWGAEPTSDMPLQEIREAYEDSHTVDEGAGDVGAGGDPDFSAEPVGADLEPEELHSYPGMMIAGDPLASAKAAALFRVDEERFKRIGQYDKESTETRLNELRGLAMGAREGSLPELSDAQNDEWQALESFMPWYTRIDGYAQDLRDNIRMAETVEAVLAVNISDGWPN